MPRIAILGSTGSIGRMTLEVLASLGPAYEVVALAAGRRVEALASQAIETGARLLGAADEAAAEALRRALPEGVTPEIVVGPEGLADLAARDEVDVVVSAVVGGAGLSAALAAARAGKRLALANKEALVMAGDLLMAEADAGGAEVLPVDSEHSAVYQAAAAGRRGEVQTVTLTASGGPFYRRPDADRDAVTPDEALDHPTWSMGRKITIDSATLVNKALEVIEAHHLFGLEADRIRVLIHPESTVHALVEFVDGSVMAQLGPPDMRTPIQYALTWPERRPSPWPRLDLAAMDGLHFETPDMARFPALDLGFEVVRRGGTAGAVFSAADEVAVEAFLAGRIRFSDIVRLADRVLRTHLAGGADAPAGDIHKGWSAEPDLETILKADAWAREETETCLTSYTSSK
ncbi:MAG: 1-deoxy-D-xylulose-5-phosphate reductoisomerase [Phycisphaerae bacterium]